MYTPDSDADVEVHARITQKLYLFPRSKCEQCERAFHRYQKVGISGNRLCMSTDDGRHKLLVYFIYFGSNVLGPACTVQIKVVSIYLIAQCRTGGLNDVLSMKEIRQYFRLTRPSANCSSGPGLPESVNTNRRVIFSYSFKVTSTECSLGRNFYFLIKATIYARKLIL